MLNAIRTQSRKIVAAMLMIGALASVPAYAADSSIDPEKATLSSNVSATVGTALNSSQISTAESALEKARIEAAKKEKEAAAAKAEAEAREKAQAAKDAQYAALLTDPVSSKTVAYSASLGADELVKTSSQSLGNYRLSFYCPCAQCNGVAGANTASGTVPEEGRTIAVDSSVIPLGSRVYIDGYGVFVAEDTGGAIKGSRIDVHVGSHTRAYELGIKYADVYLLG